MEKINKIIERQKDFQRIVGFPIDSNLESDRNEMSEKYVFKLIEEAIELRKEFPSVMNPWSKKQKEVDLLRVKEEMSDVLLFFVNLLITWKFSFDEILDVIVKVQENNFSKVAEKKLKMLNEQILNIPGYTSGIGQGSTTPKYIFVGLNPEQGIEHGHKVWSDETDGSSKVLLPILDAIGIRQDCYFTNLVKCTTPDNSEPTDNDIAFWLPILKEELEALLFSGNAVVIAMGKIVSDKLPGARSIHHPADVLRDGMSREEYTEVIKKVL